MIRRNRRRRVGPEKRLQNAIIEDLRWHHCLVIRENVGLLYSKDGRPMRTGPENGTPDLLVIKPKTSKAVMIEVKTPTGRIRPDQEAYHQDLMHRGISHGIARSVEDAEKIVKEELIGYGYPPMKG